MKKVTLKLLHPILGWAAILIYRKRIDRCINAIRRIKNDRPRVICFFPAYHMGGAEKVHLEILEALGAAKVCTIINYKSKSYDLKNNFITHSNFFIDIGVLGNYKPVRNLIRHQLVRVINQMNSPLTLFGCNTEMFYDVIDSIENRAVKCVDLIHAFSPYTTGIEIRSLKSVARLNTRILINRKTLEDLSRQYQQADKSSFIDRTIVIPNPVRCGPQTRSKDFKGQIKVLWVGRGSREKRPWLFAEIAEVCLQKIPDLSFSMAGDVNQLLQQPIPPNLKLEGMVINPKVLIDLYTDHHVLITTSEYEGFPLTISEAFCHQLVNIAVEVGGISEHVIPNQTGFLIQDADEKSIIDQSVACLEQLLQDRQLMEMITQNAKSYVERNFNPTEFRNQYRKILIN